MRKIREVLRYRYTAGLSLDAIARSLKLSKGVVAKYIRLAQDAHITWPIPDDLDDVALEKRLYRQVARSEPTYQSPDFAKVHQELKRKEVTLLLLWEEYVQEAGERAYKYTSFCTHYRAWALTLKRSMRQIHRVGEKLFADYAGPTIQIIDARTGEISSASIFVSVLGASNYTFACATPGQTQHDWLRGIELALIFIGGVTAMIVPDNPRALVSKACRYEPQLNRATQEFSEHYDTVILPARPKKPQDKAKVEVGVQIVERWILARLRKRSFFSLEELNQAISELLVQLNNRPLKKLPGSRQEAFEILDKPYLKPLPVSRFDLAEWKIARVNIDYHVALEGSYYSVPYPLVRQEVDLRITDHTVEIMSQNKRVASHPRSTLKGRYITATEHMPAAHKAHSGWTPSKLVTWGQSVGPFTGQFVDTALAIRKHPEQAYRMCLGLMNLARQYGNARIEAACERAIWINAYRYSSVQSILKTGLDGQPLPPRPTEIILPDHDNVRGPDYYH